jgi:hypothetical protein
MPRCVSSRMRASGAGSGVPFRSGGITYERYESQEHLNRHRENAVLRCFLADAAALVDGKIGIRNFRSHSIGVLFFATPLASRYSKEQDIDTVTLHAWKGKTYAES